MTSAVSPAPTSAVPIPRSEAKQWCEAWHYTHRLAGTTWLGWPRADALQAVICLGRGGNRYGVGDKFGIARFPGDVEVVRCVCHPLAPKNTASQALSAASVWLGAQGIAWCFAYSDTAEGHHGGIYQAINAVYVGTDAKQWVNFALNGSRVSKRVISGRYGTTAWPLVRDLAAADGAVLERVPWLPKLLYIIPSAKSCAVRSAIRKALAAHSKPYPQRGTDLQTHQTPYRNARPKT